jgi:glycosyltransferase involved in cell wall biosynthesis
MGLTFSIITVVHNDPLAVRCMKSVQEQSVVAQHIVIDGGSTDGTLELIEANRNASTRVVSEPDRGIYDAMNKGLALATGDIVGILSADDVYAGSDVLAKVARALEAAQADSCYGDLVYVAPAWSDGAPDRVCRYWRSGSYRARRFYDGWMPPHPTFFVRRGVYQRYGNFRLDLGSAADYELMLRFLLRHGISTAYLPEVLVRMREGGVSNRSLWGRLRANRMDRMAWRVNGLRPYPWTILMKPLSKIGQFLFAGWKSGQRDGR